MVAKKFLTNLRENVEISTFITFLVIFIYYIYNFLIYLKKENNNKIIIKKRQLSYKKYRKKDGYQ